ncbi:Orf y, partial [Tanacetum coccineum]
MFTDAVTGTSIKINIEHIEGKHNTLADSLSRLVNLYFAECTGEMKELAVAALYSMEEVLQSPNAFQKNMKTTCEEVMKISNHFLESSQKLSSHLKNQEHYTNVTSSRPTKPQSEWINLMHGDQSHNSHVKPFKRKYKDDKGRVKKCKCFICRKEEHFAKDCRSKQGNIARSAVYQELDLDDNWDIVSADFDDSNVYSISEGEGDTHQSISVMVQDTPVEETVFMAIEEEDEIDSEQEEEDNQFSHHAFMFHPGPPTKIAKMVQAVESWKLNKELPAKRKECEHEWKENAVTNHTICYYCGILTTDMSRLNCPKCQLTTCALCARNYLGKTVNVKRKQTQKSEEEKDFNSSEVKLLKELLKEKTE